MNCIRLLCTAEATHQVSTELTADVLGVEYELPLCVTHARELVTLKGPAGDRGRLLLGWFSGAAELIEVVI